MSNVPKKTLGFQVDALVQHTQMVEVEVPVNLTGEALRAFLEKEAALFVKEECFECFHGIEPSVVISNVHLLEREEEPPMPTQPIPTTRTTEPIGDIQRGNTARMTPPQEEERIIPHLVVLVRDGVVVEVKARYADTVCRVINLDEGEAVDWEANPIRGEQIEQFTQETLRKRKERA